MNQTELVEVNTEGIYVDSITTKETKWLSGNPKERVGQRVQDVLSAAIAQQYIQAVQHALQTGEPFTLEYEIFVGDQLQTFAAQVVACRKNSALFLVRTIGDRRQAKTTLQESEVNHRALLMAIPDLLIRMTGDGIYLGIANGSQNTVLNADLSSTGTASIYDILPFEVAEQRMIHVRKALQTGEPQFYEQQLMIDDQVIYEEVRIVVVSENEVLAIVRDITSRKLAEAALQRMEARNRAFLDAVPDLIIRFKQDGTYLDIVEAKGVAMIPTPYNRIGKNVYDILPKQLAAQYLHYIAQAIQSGETQQFEYQLQIGERLGDYEGRMVRSGSEEAILIVRDITDRKRSQEALRIAEENYRSIFENALEGIFQSIPEGRFINVNPAMAKIYGYDSPQEMIAAITNIATQVYVDPEDQIAFQRQLEEHDQIKNFEYRVYQKDGEIIWIQEDVRAVRNTAGQLLYYEGMIQDITNRKRRENELRRQLEELKIEIDQKKRAQEVAMLTESSYFMEVQQEMAKVNLDEFWS